MKKKHPASETGAMREALGKHYMRQVPLEALIAGAAALEYGAEKYDNRNWEKGLPWQQMIDSLNRHVADFERREEFDDGSDGSGLPQVCMIMASAMMLCASVMREIGEDDRLPKPDDKAFSAKDCTNWMHEVSTYAASWRDERMVRDVSAELSMDKVAYDKMFENSPNLTPEEFDSVLTVDIETVETENGN